MAKAKKVQHDTLLSRILLLLQKLTEDGSAHLSDLAQEHNVSERTIRRDIKKLHFFPIAVHNSVVRATDGFNFGDSRLKDIELLIAELALSSIKGIDEKTDTYLHSIRSKVSHPTFFNPYQIKPEGFESINMDSELLNKIEDAITKRNISKVQSNSLISVVEPYKVVAFDGLWYLFAKDTTDNKVKTYLVSKIEEFRATTKVYSSEHQDVEAMLSNVHTAWFEDGNSFEVKVKVKAKIAHFFKLKQHLASQKLVKENKDGSIIITFNVSTDEDVDNLIKAWLPHIEVIKPERFRKKLVLELEEYLRELKELSPSL